MVSRWSVSSDHLYRIIVKPGSKLYLYLIEEDDDATTDELEIWGPRRSIVSIRP